MPLPRFQQPAPAEQTQLGGDTSHYFDAALGDVAALHDRIERGFAAYAPGESPISPSADRLDTAIQFLSRSAGVVGLAGALILIGIAIF